MTRFALIKKELNIQLPITISGYGARTEQAQGIHDALHISCFYLEDDKQAFALFSLDLVGLYQGYYDVVKSAVQKKIQNPKLQMVFTSVHSHSAPGFRDVDVALEPNHVVLFDDLIDKAVAILQEAPKIAQPAQLFYGEKAITGVAANRRDRNVQVNTVLKKLSFNFAGKEAVVVNFPCHPTHMGPDNLLVSKDFQGAAMDLLAAQGYLPMFIQGACGDISTRFTRVDQSFADMKRIGAKFAREIENLAIDFDFAVSDFSYNEYSFDIERKKYQSETYYLSEIERLSNELAEAKKTMSAADLRILETAVAGMTREYNFSKNQNRIDTTIRCGILRLADKLAFVFLPFELFSKLGDMICAGSNYDATLIVGYSFDGLGYLPDIASYEQSGYEVTSSLFAKGAGEALAEKVISLLNQ